MSAPEPLLRGGALLGLLRSRVRIAGVAVVVLFLWAVAQFYHRDTGFSSLISIGDGLSNSKVSELREVPHYIYEGSWGYDGAYYVQLALNPTLDNPELLGAIDNLPYRAKRILFCWTAWVAGLGQPAWIVQAHALLNVVCWLVLAVVLLRWFPLNNWENFLRWAAVMFSHGMCMSVRHSLVDAPSLLLVALAMRWLDDGRSKTGAVTLALAGLGKETSLLATAGLDFDWRAPRTWLRTAVTVGLVALPLLLWIGYVRIKFGKADDPGLGNFTLPFSGFAEKLGVAWRDALSSDASSLHWAVLATVVALAAQGLFFLLRWRPADRWWRVGFTFAAMMLFLSTPVWEGYPGAATRVLLPMTLAFNVLVPRGVRWLPLVVAGNLTVAASVFEFSPPAEFYIVRGDRSLAPAVRVIASEGWHGPERHLQQQWRWSSGPAKVRFVNEATIPVSVIVRGFTSSADDLRSVRLIVGERLLWGDTVGKGQAEFRFGLTLPPGETELTITTDRPAGRVGSDPRDLAFQVSNLEIVVSPARTAR